MPAPSKHLPVITADIPPNHSWDEEIRTALKEADAGDFATSEEMDAIIKKWCPLSPIPLS